MRSGWLAWTAFEFWIDYCGRFVEMELRRRFLSATRAKAQPDRPPYAALKGRSSTATGAP